MDRIDIQVDVPAVPYKDLAGGRSAESSETIRYRVIAARNIQLRRFFDEHVYSNAQMGPRLIRKFCVLRPDCERIMEDAVTKLGFSARAYDRILKRNRTSGSATGGAKTTVFEQQSACSPRISFLVGHKSLVGGLDYRFVYQP